MRDNTLTDEVAKLEKDVFGLKSTQPFDGQAMAIGKYSSANTFDATTTVGAFAGKFIRCDFTYSDYLGAYAQMSYIPSTNTDLQFTIYPSPDNVGTNTKISWVLEIFNTNFTSSHSVSVKFYVYSVSNGSVSAVVI